MPALQLGNVDFALLICRAAPGGQSSRAAICLEKCQITAKSSLAVRQQSPTALSTAALILTGTIIVGRLRGFLRGAKLCDVERARRPAALQLQSADRLEFDLAAGISQNFLRDQNLRVLGGGAALRVIWVSFTVQPLPEPVPANVALT